jgi:hypothetical protein
MVGPAQIVLRDGAGDFTSIDATGRPALHIHLPAPDATLLRDALAQIKFGAVASNGTWSRPSPVVRLVWAG